jgi:hypothetical protein
VQESTISATLLRKELRPSSGNVIYEYEYDLDSTRGRKRILNVVTIHDSRLYIVNAQCKCGNSGCDVNQVNILRKVASSFNID